MSLLQLKVISCRVIVRLEVEIVVSEWRRIGLVYSTIHQRHLDKVSPYCCLRLPRYSSFNKLAEVISSSFILSFIFSRNLYLYPSIYLRQLQYT